MPRLSGTTSVGCHDGAELDYVIYTPEFPFSAFYNKHLAPGLAARDDARSPSPGFSLQSYLIWPPQVASGGEVFISLQLAEKHMPRGWDAGSGNHFLTPPANDKP